MSANSTSEGFSLKRWSRRKVEAARAADDPVPTPAAVPPAAPSSDLPAVKPAASLAAPAPLPPVESLTIDSDFSAFLEPEVDEGLKRLALKQLFRDPHFNVMDGLDVYIDDYSKPDPISPDIVRKMVQGRYIFDPPVTRVNEEGVVEDVPEGDAETETAKTEALPESAPAEPTVPAPDPSSRETADTEPVVTPRTTGTESPSR